MEYIGWILAVLIFAVGLCLLGLIVAQYITVEFQTFKYRCKIGKQIRQEQADAKAKAKRKHNKAVQDAKEEVLEQKTAEAICKVREKAGGMSSLDALKAQAKLDRQKAKDAEKERKEALERAEYERKMAEEPEEEEESEEEHEE
jgi:hypothetical protein